jgi:hypothetical protein
MMIRPQKVEGFKGREKAILMGSLLGDGMLQKRGISSFRYRASQGIKQEEYLNWKYGQLKRLCTTTQPPKKVTDKKGFVTVEFYSSSGNYLKEYFDLFYKESAGSLGKAGSSYVKKITGELIDELPMQPEVLAVWFMDDGSVRGDSYAANLATQCFSKKENQLLQGYLKKWGINSSISRHTKLSDQYYLYIGSGNFQKLVEIIEPIVKEVPSMEYKLNEARRGKARPGSPPAWVTSHDPFLVRRSLLFEAGNRLFSIFK